MIATKQACYICNKELVIEDLSTCQRCGKDVCDDCQTIQGYGDEYWIECIWCREEKHDRRIK